jgi:Ca2+-binding RTX toxin-like protein
MAGLDHNTQDSVAAVAPLSTELTATTGIQSAGSSLLDKDLSDAIGKAFDGTNLSNGQKQEIQTKAQGNVLDTIQKLELSGASTSTLSKTQITSSVSQAIATTSGLSTDQKETVKENVAVKLNTIADTATLTDGVAGTPAPTPPVAPPDDHDHAPLTNGQINHVDTVDGLQSVKNFNGAAVRKASSFGLLARTGKRGDLLDPGAGINTVIGGVGSDVVFGNGGGFNTITTGAGRDRIILGEETTNRIFDFDATKDALVLSNGIKMEDLIITQGKNPGKGGLDQPTDSLNNTLIIDKRDGHILASLNFVKAETLTESNFRTISDTSVDALKNNKFIGKFFKAQAGDGQLTGTLGKDKLIGGAANDFLYVGNDGFKLNSTVSGVEFPFATTSPGEMTMNFEMKSGNLKISGKYENADGAPLFSQGETTIDPTATFNGGNAAALVEGFLKVPVDKEGNKIGGLHMHLSPAGDDRGDFADATVVRYLDITPTDAKNGTMAGDFDLSPEEQAAFLAGLNYFNLHTNVDLDKDGKGGFANGEMRLNANKNVVQFV